MSEEIIIYIDGGSRGNPGPAAAAYVLLDRYKKILQGKGFFLGHTTNNVAEYTALIKALQAVKQIGPTGITILSDSELLVKQINGQYRVKNSDLKVLYNQGIAMLGQFPSWKMQYTPRERNIKADKLVNRALDLQKDVQASRQMKTQKGKLTRLGILISGSGRTIMNIHNNIKAGKLNAQIAVVISSRSTVSGVDKAKAAGFDVKIVRKKDYPDIDRFSEQIAKELDSAGAELVIQGGWLCLWKIPEKYINRVMNIHPALLPSFGGKGMWGHHVHEAVLRSGCKVSGCTAHFCTNEYDKGPIIIQRCCEVMDDDTPDTLAARVFEQECIAYPEAIRLFSEGKILVQQGIVKINNRSGDMKL